MSDEQADAIPEAVWLCPDRLHAEEFYVPHGGRCPSPGCEHELVEFRRVAAPHMAGSGEAERIENARRIIDKLWAEALMCDTGMLVDHVAVECRKALAALNGPAAQPDAERAGSGEAERVNTDIAVAQIQRAQAEAAAHPDAERAPEWADPTDKMTAGEMPRLAEWKNAERAPGAPGRGFGGKLICLCKRDRSYCPHTEGQCPWWDREPIEPEWSRPDAERAGSGEAERLRIAEESRRRVDAWNRAASAAQPDAERAPDRGDDVGCPDCNALGECTTECRPEQPSPDAERAPQDEAGSFRASRALLAEPERLLQLYEISVNQRIGLVTEIERARAERALQPEPRQDSLIDQMRDVMRLAVEAGCYDAHEWLRGAFPFPESSRRAPTNDAP